MELLHHQAFYRKEVSIKDLYDQSLVFYKWISWYCNTILEIDLNSIAEHKTIED